MILGCGAAEYGGLRYLSSMRLLLLVNNGRPSAVKILEEDFEAVAANTHVVADLDRDPIIVLRDRRRRTPYLPDHRTLESWLKGLAEDVVSRR